MKFKKGDWVCDIGDQSMGVKVVSIKQDGMLIVELEGNEFKLDPELVEIYKKKKMNEQKRISDWLTLAGVESPEKPQFPDSDKLQLALGLVLEELTEAAEAASYIDFKEFLTTSVKTFQEALLNLKNSDNKKEEGDLDEFRDACADMRVVMGNLIHFAGIKEKFNEDFEEVMNSNFSKFCKTEQEAKDSVEAYILGTHPNKMGSVIDCYYEKVGEYWIIKRDKDNKVMKSIGYTEPNFTKI